MRIEATGLLVQKKSLSSTDKVKEIGWLISLGITAVILHSLLKLPLHLPGHHGIEWLALLMIGRFSSSLRWSSTITSTTAAGLSAIPLMGFSDPFMPLMYFLPGLLIDLFYFLYKMKLNKAVMIAIVSLIAGLAYTLQPLVRIIISSLTHWPYKSFLSGVIYPIFTHFVFGFIGGLTGILIILLSKKGKQLFS